MKDLWFIHIPKCGGSSIKKALSIDTGHQTLYSMANSMDCKYFKNAFKFAFIRNPYDRLRSLYMFNCLNKQHGLSRYISFNEWISLVLLYKIRPYYYTASYFEPCFNWVSIDGEIQVDFIGKLETIAEDFDKLCKILELDVNLPHINYNKQTVPSYSKSSFGIVSNIFKKDIDLWYPNITLQKINME